MHSLHRLLSRESEFSSGTLEDLEHEKLHVELLMRNFARKLAGVGELRSRCSATLQAHDAGKAVKTATQLERIHDRAATLRRTSGALQSVMIALEQIYVPSVDKLIEQAKEARTAKRERPEALDEDQDPMWSSSMAPVKSEPAEQPAKRVRV